MATEHSSSVQQLPLEKRDPRGASTRRNHPPAAPPPSTSDAEKTIVIRDRRKPNQYTTDNVIAREWLPVLRVGDAFFFYSIYLSMANRETESSWGSLRTQAEYLQCGVDLIIRGNKLLEICELLYIETGDQRTTNEYYILDPPPLTPELKARIYQRLEAVADQESSKNWQAWVNQVRKALDQHRSLPSIWAERRTRRGGRPVKAVRAENPDRDSQPGFSGQDADKPRQDGSAQKGGCEPQAGWLWDTSRVVVSHKQGGCEPQPEQEQLTRGTEQGEEKEPALSLVRAACQELGIAPTVVDVLIENHAPDEILQQLEWLPFRSPRDPAAMLVSAVQGNWAQPSQYAPPLGQASEGQVIDGEEEPACEERERWPDTTGRPGETGRPDTTGSPGMTSQPDAIGILDAASLDEPGWVLEETDLDARRLWASVLEELRMQMTRATFDTWLGGSQVAGVDGDTLIVQVRDAYAAEWLQARWITPVQRTVSGVAGRHVLVQFRAMEGWEDP
jgi:hypothetical protein